MAGRPLAQVLRATWDDLRRLCAVGPDQVQLAVFYRAWQLGHRIRLMQGGERPHALCTCGWDGPATRNGGWTMAAFNHQFDVVMEADGTYIPRITNWPNGIGPDSTIAELVQALTQLDD